MSAAPHTSQHVPVPGWREEMRQDRLIRAQIGRDREAARAELRITERDARARARREDAQARTAARQQARQARAARRAGSRPRGGPPAARVAWVRPCAGPAVRAGDRGPGGAGVDRDGRLRLPALRAGRAGAARVQRGRHVGVRRRHHRDPPPSPGPAGLASAARHGHLRRLRRRAELRARHDAARRAGPARPGRRRGVRGGVGRGGDRAPARHRRAAPLPRRAGRRPHRPRGGPAGDGRPPRRRSATRSPTWTSTATPGWSTSPARPSWPAAVAGPGSAPPRPAAAPAAPAPRRAGATRRPGHAPAPRPHPPPAPPHPHPGCTRTRAHPHPATPVHPHPHPAAPRVRSPARPPRCTSPPTSPTGRVPSARRIKSELHVGQDRAARIHDHLTAVATAPPRQPSGRTA